MSPRIWIAIAVALAGCAAPAPEAPPMTASEGRTLVARYLPAKVSDREGWAADIYAAFATLHLGAIAWKEIERQRERAGIPRLVLDAALALPSTNGKSYRERIDAARTEGELSDVFEDFIGRVPLGKRFFEERNPVRTAGPMQVSVVFARAQAARSYYASRNAAFQKAVSELSGVPLAQDGDLVRFSGAEPARQASATELAVRTLAPRLHMDASEIRHDLELGRSRELEKSQLYSRVFEMAERASGKTIARAAVPAIELQSAKITRKLTTEWFARRVAERQRACLARGDRS